MAKTRIQPPEAPPAPAAERPASGQPDSAESVLARAAAVPELAAKIRRLGQDKGKVVFDHVAPPAQPFLAAVIARELTREKRSLWLLCETEHAQERLHGELLAWLPDALIFPHLEISAVEGAIPDPEVNAERLAVLERLSHGGSGAVVLTRAALDEKVPSPRAIEKLSVTLKRDARADRDELIQKLVQSGYEGAPQVSERGQFAVRGGVLDIYSWQHVLPVRLEWFDDLIESIREFQVDEQTSVRTLDACTLLLGEPEKAERFLRQYLKKFDVLLAVESEGEDCHGLITSGAGGEATEDAEDYSMAFFESPFGERRATPDAAMRHAFEHKVKRQLGHWLDDGYRLVFQHQKKSEAAAIEAILSDLTISAEKPAFLASTGNASFVFPAGRLAVLSGTLFVGNQPNGQRRNLAVGSRRGLAKTQTQIDFTELTEGALVVHLEHGLARFEGIRSTMIQPEEDSGHAPYLEETMVLEFAEGARLFVPLEQSFLVSRYVGMGKRGAGLSKLGDGKWNSTKEAAEKSIYDYAAKLLKVQAARELHPGTVFEPDGAWQREFEDAFPYRETADQLKAIRDTKADMESGRSMDRLVCGDVGFGKTEVAIRAAFKAAVSGKQAAVMAPTTVLAQQHFENFRARMANFPVVVESLSGYRSRAEQDAVAQGLRDGTVDIVVGTHRLISKDVTFKDLGLLVVDEEQRFGVKHKERIKERFPSVDVLTLSATPIPRTLYLALTGARDLSTLETPPPNRYPVETVICPYDERIIRAAVDRELDREGQIYFLHNRVESIAGIAARIRHLCPRARVDIGHGQMETGELEEVMRRFVAGETDVLVATTIIESGLDIPNANTIIIDRADRFGLADLYQLRGRVGRGSHKAYAYLMLPRDLLTVGEARKRINAIKQYSALGAGFKIALRDLEIRGAGNILGVAQSGHLTAIGFDLYCQLLRQAVSRMKGEKTRQRLEVVMHLDFVAGSEGELAASAADHAREAAAAAASPLGGEEELAAARPSPSAWPAFLPSSFIEDPKLRIQAYRQLAGVARTDELDALQETWRDRFGRLPDAAENLLALTRLKLLAASRRIRQVETRGSKLMLKRGEDYVQTGGKFPRLTSGDPVSKMREISNVIENL